MMMMMMMNLIVIDDYCCNKSAILDGCMDWNGWIELVNSGWGEVAHFHCFVQVIQYLRGSVCGFSGRLPDVCCPKEKPVGDEML